MNAANAQSTPFTALALRLALRKRFPTKSHSLMFEVPSEPGGRSRRADAVAVGLWPSAGLHIHGFELKVTREDFLRELQQPDKHIDVARYCHHWWLVAPTGIVRKGELPSNWGLLELASPEGNLRQSREAALLEPAVVDAPFLAGLLSSRSRLDDEEIEESIKREIRTRVHAMQGDFDRRVEQQAGFRTEQAREVLARAEQVKEQTGIDLLHWRPPHDMIALLKMALDGDLIEFMWRLRHTADSMSKLGASITDVLPDEPPEISIGSSVGAAPRKA